MICKSHLLGLELSHAFVLRFRHYISLSEFHDYFGDQGLRQWWEAGFPALDSWLTSRSSRWNSRCTHLLLPDSWTRGAKVLAAMASGAWLLSENYLAASKEAHLLVEEVHAEPWQICFKNGSTTIFKTAKLLAPVQDPGCYPCQANLVDRARLLWPKCCHFASFYLPTSVTLWRLRIATCSAFQYPRSSDMKSS